MGYIAILLLLMLLCLAGPLPFRVFAVARRNARRMDGSFSTYRLRTEAKHIGSLFGEFLLVVIAAVSVFGIILMTIHEYIVPLPMVADMLSQFHLNPERWEYNIEHGDLGDMGAHYEAWSRRRGFSDSSARFWQEFLWVQWLGLAVIGLTLLYYFGRFLVHFYGTALVTYAHGVLKRNKAYTRRDLEALKAKRKSPRRKDPDIIEARFVETVMERNGRSGG